MINSDIDPLKGIMHCPLCGRELTDADKSGDGGWDCRCGEFIAKSLALNSREGCTHGMGCNCAREMRF